MNPLIFRVKPTPLIFLAFSLMLDGCAIDGGARDADLRIPDAWRHRTSTAGETADDDRPKVDLQRWWKPFQEPTLDRLVAEVVRSNLGVREALARLSAAQAAQRAQSTSYRPGAQVAASSENTPDARQTFYQLGLQAHWPLGLFGRDAANRQSAGADTGLALADAQSVHAAVVAETVRTYLEWRAARAASANTDAQIDAQSQRTQLTRTRLRLRLSSDREVEAEAAHLARLQSRRLALDRTITETTERLGLLLARAVAAQPEGDSAGVPSFSAVRIEQVPANLVRTRADIRHAEQTVLKASAELDLARADLYPQLTLGGSLMLALPVAGTAGAAHAVASGGPAIEIPLFDWGRRRARMDAQGATLDAALIAYRESVLTGIHEVETALGNLESLRRDTELHRAQVAEAARAEERVQKAVQLHRASQLDELTARISSLESDAALLEAEREHALAYVALFEALGGASLPTIAS